MNIVALLAGGFVGTLLRYAAGVWIPHPGGVFPLGTAAINVCGCLFLGWLFTAASGIVSVRPEIRLGLGTGAAGAFTTFSTFSVETVQLFADGQAALALLYVLINVVGGLLCALAGAHLARRMKRKPKEAHR